MLLLLQLMHNDDYDDKYYSYPARLNWINLPFMDNCIKHLHLRQIANRLLSFAIETNGHCGLKKQQARKLSRLLVLFIIFELQVSQWQFLQCSQLQRVKVYTIVMQ